MDTPKDQIDPAKLDHAWNIFKNTQDMIKYADQKVHVLIVLGTLFTSFVLANLDKILKSGEFEFGMLIIFTLSTIAFIFFALSAMFARSDTRTGNKIPKQIYFGHVASRKEPVEYFQEFQETEGISFLEDICYQIYEVSLIATKKFVNYRNCWISLLIQVISLLFIVIGLATP